jgi:hypothetical protein
MASPSAPVSPAVRSITILRSAKITVRSGAKCTKNQRFKIAQLRGTKELPSVDLVANFGCTANPVKASLWPRLRRLTALTGYAVQPLFATMGSTARCGRGAISNRRFSSIFRPLLTDHGGFCTSVHCHAVLHPIALGRPRVPLVPAKHLQ